MALRAFSSQYKSPDFEFFTTEEDAARLLMYTDKSKSYICPFDKKESRIYSVLKSAGYDVVCLDDLGVEKFEDIQADAFGGRVIVTNPPFDSRKGYYSKMSKLVDEMIVVILPFTFAGYTSHRNRKTAPKNLRRWSDEFRAEILFPLRTWDRPDGSRVYSPSCYFARFERIML